MKKWMEIAITTVWASWGIGVVIAMVLIGRGAAVGIALFSGIIAVIGTGLIVKST